MIKFFRISFIFSRLRSGDSENDRIFAWKPANMREGTLISVLIFFIAYIPAGAQKPDTSGMLSPVNVTGIRTVNGVGHLPDVKGSIIYAGKKTEVIIVDSLDANKAIN